MAQFGAPIQGTPLSNRTARTPTKTFRTGTQGGSIVEEKKLEDDMDDGDF